MTNQKSVDNKRIVLDCDSVLLDCVSSFVRVASELVGRPLATLSNAYDFCHRYGLTNDQVEATYEAMRNHPAGWGNLPALPGAVEAVARLQRQGYEIHIVTAIPPILEGLRNENLENHGIRPAALHCAGHARAGKSEIIRQIDPVVFVDDRLSHLHEADFVEHRVLIDCGVDQEGHEICDGIISTPSLSDWVDAWFLHMENERPAISIRRCP